MKNLFNSFYHNDKLITPATSNDWKVIPSNTIDYINIQSKRLNQTILISVSSLVDYLNIHNVSIDSNQLIESNFIFDKFLNIVPADEYEIWKKNDDMNKNIENNDLKEGNVYKLNDGLMCVYLGYKYISKLIMDKYISFDRITEIEKKHFILLHDEVVELNEYIFSDSESQALTKEESNRKLEQYCETNFYMASFEDEKIENPKYGFVKTIIPSPFLQIGDKYYTKVQNSNNIDTCWLFGTKFIKTEKKFEFELDLNGKDFSIGQCIPITQNKSNDINLVRIGLI